jgi:cellulase/cellobiase CelA1
MLMRKTRVGQVIFKLDDPYLEQLEKSAAALQMRPNLYARRLVIQSLMNLQLERMEYRLDLMQEGMAAGFEKVLTQLLIARNEIGMVGEDDERSEREQQEDIEKVEGTAREWVKNHILREADDQRS